jgi:dolichol-phosphate mannosyltransferase
MSAVAASQELVWGSADQRQSAMPRLAPHIFVVPAYNEIENLPRLFADLEQRESLFPPGSLVLIVDDGSEDGTPDFVRGYDGRLSVGLVALERNQGPGAAFRAGFAAALEACSEDALIITLEADTTSDLDALPRMIERAKAEADIVIAAWKMVNVSSKRRLLSKGAGFIVRHALGVDAKTVSSFFRVYRASALRTGFARYGERFIRESGFACKAEVLAKLAALKLRIEEVPVELDCGRRIGESKMPIFKTVVAYWRLLARQLVAKAPEAA